jgi:hypothetical protein
MPPGDGPLAAAAVRTVRRSKRCRRPATRPRTQAARSAAFPSLIPGFEKIFASAVISGRVLRLFGS